MPDPLDRRFLEHFAQDRRSAIANIFLRPIRDPKEPITQPHEVIEAVRRRLLDDKTQANNWRVQSVGYSYEAWDERVAKITETEDALDQWPDDAEAYARYCLEVEGMPYAERMQYKAEQRGERITMIRPTPKQLDYIRVLEEELGVEHVQANNQQEASTRIETLKAERFRVKGY